MSSQPNIILRSATADDAVAILRIYTPYIQETAITYEIDVPSIEDFRKRVEGVLAHPFPYIVAVDSETGCIVGYCYAHTFRERAAFSHCVETSIYIDRDCRAHGIGRMLYEELERRLRAQGGFRNLIAIITWREEEDQYVTHNSVDFHKHMGYTLVGHLHKCGHKFGQWFDSVLMEKFL